MKRIYCAIFLLAGSLWIGCRQHRTQVQPAVYHWESYFNLGPQELDWLQTQQIRRIYLRMFDIDWDAQLRQAIPVGVLQPPDSTFRPEREIVPTFFITNRTFQNLSVSETDSLVVRMLRKTRLKLGAQLNSPLVREWQFDCDWTESTRAMYFRFLENMERELQKEGVDVSATIRLHQVKYYRRTGVPPVDRGMLMFYNMGELADPETANSILDLETAQGYYFNFDTYPLSLDLALPLFRWGIVLRNEKMVRLINGLSVPDLQDTSRFHFRDATHVEIRKSTYLNGYYLYSGDEIRLEWIPVDLLHAAARDMHRVMPRAPEWISFYHLSPETIKHYSHEELETVCKILER